MRIVTDSAAELSPKDIKEYGVDVEPLIINLQDGAVPANAINVDQFYDSLEAAGQNLPTTSQPSPGSFAHRYLEHPDPDILGVYISAGLSGTVQSANIAAEQCAERTIDVVNSRSVAGGQRYQVIAAALAAAKGWTKEQIQLRLDEIRKRTELLFTLETLKYLAYGGRIGRVKAVAGSLLNVKPVIRLDQDGVLTTFCQMHSRKRARRAIVDRLVELYGSREPLWVTVHHGRWPAEADLLEQELRGALHIERLDTIRLSAILGIHTGPGVVGCGVVPMSLFSDLI